MNPTGQRVTGHGAGSPPVLRIQGQYLFSPVPESAGRRGTLFVGSEGLEPSTTRLLTAPGFPGPIGCGLDHIFTRE